MACAAIRVVISEEEQYRLTVTPGTSRRARIETTRPMLCPCSPPGRPHPQIRSSICVGSSSGTLSSTLVTTCAARSSGLTSTRDPLGALPIGERPYATITASVIGRLYAFWEVRTHGALAAGDGLARPGREDVHVDAQQPQPGDAKGDHHVDVERPHDDHCQEQNREVQDPDPGE